MTRRTRKHGGVHGKPHGKSHRSHRMNTGKHYKHRHGHTKLASSVYAAYHHLRDSERLPTKKKLNRNYMNRRFKNVPMTIHNIHKKSKIISYTNPRKLTRRPSPLKRLTVSKKPVHNNVWNAYWKKVHKDEKKSMHNAARTTRLPIKISAAIRDSFYELQQRVQAAGIDVDMSESSAGLNMDNVLQQLGAMSFSVKEKMGSTTGEEKTHLKNLDDELTRMMGKIII